MKHDKPEAITLAQFTAMSVPTALLILWAMLAPELGGDLELGRTRLTIWATTFLLVPGLGFWLFRTRSQAVANLSYLFWTGAWVVFALHAYWAIFIIFNGIPDTFVQQGPLIAGGNFLLLTVWTIDVLMIWLLPARFQSFWVQLITRLLAFLIFAVTLVVLRGGTIQILGFVFAGLLAAGALVRAIVQVPDARMEA
ncbi:hypothetical protein [Labrenzia sp. 011]|uniref:hypothetical protein n=1 Tax=Labrenzia sp. 011 TaxID=2171494 RepID=UPI000D512B78|nr:hypothetical protein [Labrenzia sp. 011]PVB60097.1 hypothetical protein DCO57_18775 [Labrenzia sp. 011]